MRAVSEGHIPTPSAIAEGWKAFSSSAPGESEALGDGADEAISLRAALRQAESVIHAQEERIRLLEETALTDELTGLLNRRGFLAAFAREQALARRDADNEGLLVMIDLDGFKAINDTWGHVTGDAYLRAVADCLKDAVRASDTVARLGGDEFALLIAHVDEDAGARCLARIEKAFHKKVALAQKLPLRASFGFASYTGLHKADAVMRVADLRLYARKVRAKKLRVATAR
jgi:diguanylate cyclase (GGDEF)-like protein